jgi:adenine-specific DNA-methyltransferase
VLKLLSNSYREQVKCIYIAPPYNTEKDVVYSDKFNQDKREYWEDNETTENGGNRKYILVQLPEATDEKREDFTAGYKKISDITIKRNKRVVEKIMKEKKDATPDFFKQDASIGSPEQEQLKGLGFKVFKLQKSNFPRVEFAPDPEKMSAENIELL